MTNEFVSYEIAMELKKLGFQEPCFGNYKKVEITDAITGYSTNRITFDMMHFKMNFNEFNTDTYASAPLFQQAFRWFREKYGLFGDYTMGDNWNNFYWQIWRSDTMTKTYVCSSNYVFETYEEAELECLKKLIEITKKQNNG